MSDRYERFSALFKNEDFQIDKNSEDFRRSHASGFGRQSREEEEESEAAAESDVFSEDFELLNTHDGENREKKESEEPNAAVEPAAKKVDEDYWTEDSGIVASRVLNCSGSPQEDRVRSGVPRWCFPLLPCNG